MIENYGHFTKFNYDEDLPRCDSDAITKIKYVLNITIFINLLYYFLKFNPFEYLITKIVQV